MTQSFTQHSLFKGPVTFSGPVTWSFHHAPVPEGLPPGVFLAAYMGSMVVADHRELEHADRVVGLHSGAGDLALQGIAHSADWSLAPGRPVYLGEEGVPTTSVPASGFQQQVGVAITDTQMALSLHTAIILA